MDEKKFELYERGSEDLSIFVGSNGRVSLSRGLTGKFAFDSFRYCDLACHLETNMMRITFSVIRSPSRSHKLALIGDRISFYAMGFFKKFFPPEGTLSAGFGRFLVLPENIYDNFLDVVLQIDVSE